MHIPCITSQFGPHVISYTRLPPTFRVSISGGKRKPGNEVTVTLLYMFIIHIKRVT